MGIFKGIVKGVGKGVGALARGVRNRRVIKQGGAVSGLTMSSKKISRMQKRQEKKLAGGGFLRRAITRRREKKAAGLLPRQIRNQYKLAAAGIPQDQQPTDITTGLPSDITGITGAAAQQLGLSGSGGADGNEIQQGTGMNGAFDWLQKNWLWIGLGALCLYIFSKLFTKKKK